MSKYIDAEKLIAEIERRKKQDITFRERNILVDIEVCIASLRADMIITSLQQEQPEVDLEKELDKYLRGEFKQTAGGNFNNYIQVARHFYELGLNARKED